MSAQDIRIKVLTHLAYEFRKTEPELSFNIIEIGAVPVGDKKEPFHLLIDLFPGTQINAFEVDEEICANLNQSSPVGFKFHAVALGRREEERTFHITNNPICSSLNKPNEKLIDRYNGFELTKLKSTTTIKTESLDYFTSNNHIHGVDFIKLDIQGAELEVLMGGEHTLKDVISIISEVEFVPQYESQPLFGDVCNYLASKRLDFHKFLGIGGRTLKPYILNNDPYFSTQQIWSDAVFLRSMDELPQLSSAQLLKIASIALIYNSMDVTAFYLAEYDKRNNTQLIYEFQSTLNTLVSSNHN